jgi:hypothetical protein
MHAADGHLHPCTQLAIPHAQAVSTSVILGLLMSLRHVVRATLPTSGGSADGAPFSLRLDWALIISRLTW